MVTRYSSDFFFFLPQVCFLVRRHIDKNRELKIRLREREREREEIRSQFCHGSWHLRPSSPRAACCSPHAHCHDHQPWLLLQDTRVEHTPSSSFLPSFLLPWLERNTRRGAAWEKEEERRRYMETQPLLTIVRTTTKRDKTNHVHTFFFFFFFFFFVFNHNPKPSSSSTFFFFFVMVVLHFVSDSHKVMIDAILIVVFSSKCCGKQICV
jgi:hypothetical protein